MILTNPSIKGIAFDLDDTLFSRNQAMRSLLTSWMGPNPCANSIETIVQKDRQGYSDRDAFFSWLVTFLKLSIPSSDLHRKFIAELPQHIPRQTQSIKLINTLGLRNYSVAILTNGGSALQRAKLRACGISEHIPKSQTIIAGDTPFDKPAGEIFQLLAKTMLLPAKDILYVGDHSLNDIAGSQAAGFQSAWMRLNRPIPEKLSPGILVLDSLDELLHHLLGHQHD